MRVVYGKEFIQHFEDFAPKALAEDGDPIGVAVGTLDKPIKKILVTLDVRPEVVQEAIEEKVDLIFSHHPPIFRPLKNLQTDHPQNKMYADLLKHDITVYSAHTNLDAAEGGMNDWLAEELGLKNTNILTVTKTETYKKITVFVPVESEQEVTRAMHQADAGEVGDYKYVSYLSKGEGRFTPQSGSNPTIGELGKKEIVAEVKVEMMLPENKGAEVIHALKKAHPYEEPVFDLYTLEQDKKEYGYGRVGELAQTKTLKEYIKEVAEVFGVEGLRYVTYNPEKKIKTVAIMGGSGEKYYREAILKGADVFITGDLNYHTGHDMLAEGLSAIDPGHHIESVC